MKSLSSVFDLYAMFPTSHRLYATKQTRKVAKQYGLDDVVDDLDRLIAHDEETTLALERKRAAQRTGGAPTEGDARAHDLSTDRLVSAFYRTIEAGIDGLDPDDAQETEMTEALAGFLHEHFPQGISSITQRSFVSQLSAMRALVEAARVPALADARRVLGLNRLIKRLEAAVTRYEELISHDEAPIPYEQVQQARYRGQELMLSAIARIVGTYYDSEDAAHVEARAALLAPILGQQQAIREQLVKRRRVGEVDPNTGDPIADPNESDT